MNVVSLFLIGELMQRIDGLAAVPLAVAYVLCSAHNGNVELSVTRADMVPVNKVDMCEFAAVKNAVLDGHSLASAEEYRAEMTVGVHARIVAGLVYVSAELRVYRTGVAVLMLLGKVGNYLTHDVKQVVLEIFELKAVDIVRAFLYHNGAGGVVRSDGDGSVLYAGSLDNVNDLACYIVKGGYPTSRLELELLLKYLEFHNFLLRNRIMYGIP